VRCPTLVLVGEDDPITPVEDSLDIAAALPAEHARLLRFPDCGHGVFRDDPEAAFAEIRAFLGGLAPAPERQVEDAPERALHPSDLERAP
jgi:proline iminopeptidase